MIKRLAVLTVLVVSALVLAQTRDILLTTADVDAVVAGANIQLFPDGGCALTVIYSGATQGVVAANAKTRPFNGARCGVVTTAVSKAAYLDHTVGDGSQP